MSIAIGRIRGGQVVVEGEGGPLPEGKRVMLVIEDDDASGFRLDEASRKELLEAIAELNLGHFVTEEQLDAELDALE
jgi:hypothetical protein